MNRKLAALLTLAALAPLPALAADSILFRYRLQPEATYEQAMTMGMTMRMDVEGLPPDQAAALGGFVGQDIKLDMTMKMEMQTAAKAGDGTIPIEMRIAGSEVSLTMGGQASQLPVPAVEQVIRGKLTADGRMVELDLSGVEGAEGVPRELLDRLSQITPALPEKAMRVGDTLEIPVSFDTPLPMGGAGGQMKLDGMTIFTLRQIAGNEAAFDVRMKLAMDASGADADQLGMKMSGGGEGTATFDVKEGLFSRMHLDVGLEMNMSSDAGAAPEGGAAPMRMKMSVRGPMEMTMSRVAARR